MEPATITIRTREQIGGFFGGLELHEPGVPQPQHGRPGPGRAPIYTSVPAHRGVARKN